MHTSEQSCKNTNPSGQVYNPFLPLQEYIPDGEPHIFDGRVYLYGSHDREGGYTFCMEDYVTYSTPVDDLTAWRYEGVIYRADQDPDYPAQKYMYAPDVVRGNDGRYYLYYCMSGDYGEGGYTGTIHVAVSESPCGPFRFLGEVKYPDGTPMRRYVCFDPAVLNDDGVIRVYYGTQYDYEEQPGFEESEELILREMKMFGRTKEEILSYRREPESCAGGCMEDPDCIMGPVMLTLEEDMLTVKEAPRHIIPYKVAGTGFEAHPFFEASSMRKIGEKYYFIYSSQLNHELCYAVSDHPDRDFVFGGTIVSNGDLGYEGRTIKHNMTGTTHGSIIKINGQWYVFYHRLTHKSDYSRQACAEKIRIEEDGRIRQVEVTSCGLNQGPLSAGRGDSYPAPIACIITNGNMPHGCNSIFREAFPHVNHKDDARFIAQIDGHSLIGFKYFAFEGVSSLTLTVRMESERNRIVYDGPIRRDERSGLISEEMSPPAQSALCGEEMPRAAMSGFGGEEGMRKESSDALVKEGNDASESSCSKNRPVFLVRTEEDGEIIGKIEVSASDEWTDCTGTVDIPDGVHGLFLSYQGTESLQLLKISFA